MLLVLFALVGPMVPVGASPAAAPLGMRSSTWIAGDGDFDEEHGVVGGSGTAEDPFVIRGWFAIAPESYGLRLSGTRAHVVIEDVRAEGVPGDPFGHARCASLDACDANRGIELVDAQNVTVRGFGLSGTGLGVYAAQARNLTIESSDIHAFAELYSPGVGVFVIDSADVVLRDNRLRSSLAWSVERSSGVRIEGGTVQSQPWRPRFIDSSDVAVEDASIVGGLYFLRSESIRLTGNTFEQYGMVAAVSDPDSNKRFRTAGILACGNRWASDNVEPAFALMGVADALVVGNVVEQSQRSFRSEWVENVTITQNDFQRATGSGKMEGGRGLAIHQNSFGPGTRGIEDDWIASPSGSATHNWWGHASGPAPHGEGVPAATALPVAPWLTAPPALGPVDCDAVPTPPRTRPASFVHEVTFHDPVAIKVRFRNAPNETALLQFMQRFEHDGRGESAQLFIADDPWSPSPDPFVVRSIYSSAGVEVSVSVGEPPGSYSIVPEDGRSSGRGRAISCYGICEKGAFVAFAGDPGHSITMSFVTTTEDHGFEFEVLGGVGIVTLERMAGPRAEASWGVLSASYARDVTSTVRIERELWGFSGALGAWNAWFTRDGPDGEGLSMEGRVDEGGAPGEYTYRFSAAAGSSARRPVALWVDLDLPDVWKTP